MNTLVVLIGLCSLSHPVVAMVVSRYETISAPVTSDLMTCGIAAMSKDYCAVRVATDNTCEPLTKVWCETTDTSSAGDYFIKRMHGQAFEDPYIASIHQEKIPIYITEGSEVEIRFMLHTGWSRFQFDLTSSDYHTVLRIRFAPDNSLIFCWRPDIAVIDQNEEGYFGNYTVSNNVVYTLRIVSLVTTREFEIYLNGEYVWKYLTHVSLETITDVTTHFFGVGGGSLYYITYTAGN